MIVKVYLEKYSGDYVIDCCIAEPEVDALLNRKLELKRFENQLLCGYMYDSNEDYALPRWIIIRISQDKVFFSVASVQYNCRDRRELGGIYSVEVSSIEELIEKLSDLLNKISYYKLKNITHELHKLLPVRDALWFLEEDKKLIDVINRLLVIYKRLKPYL